MDREDRRRYFIVGSVILEIVTPLFWKRIENDYISCGLASLQDFLNKQSTMHVLFHLRHRNTLCCKDKTKCSNNRSLPLQYCQWDLLYTETNPGVNPHDCHCKFSANPVHLDDLDITLASLILLNCSTLTRDERDVIKELRQYKNDYLSHNIKGAITKNEYRTLWADLTKFILQLDPSKQDNLTRIEARPLDEALCSRYCISLLHLHERLDEIYSTIQTMNNSVSSSLQNMNTTVQSSLQYMGTKAQSSLQNVESSMQTIGDSVQSSLQNMETSMQGTLRNIDTSLQESLFYARRGMACQCYVESSENQGQRKEIVCFYCDGSLHKEVLATHPLNEHCRCPHVQKTKIDNNKVLKSHLKGLYIPIDMQQPIVLDAIDEGYPKCYIRQIIQGFFCEYGIIPNREEFFSCLESIKQWKTFVNVPCV